MKKIILPTAILFTLVFCCTIISVAQNAASDTATVTDSTKEKEKISIYAGAAYSSRLHYYGRTDSLKSSAFLPTVIIQAGKHFSVTPTFIFIKNSNTNFEYAATIINATYSFGKRRNWTMRQLLVRTPIGKRLFCLCFEPQNIKSQY